MRLTYNGNHLFGLPKAKTGVQLWKKGETHDCELWESFKDRADIKALVANGSLVPHDKVQKPFIKHEEVKEEKQPDSRPEKTDDVLKELLSAHYKLAIQRVSGMDRGLLSRWLEREVKPSVRKAIEQELSK